MVILDIGFFFMLVSCLKIISRHARRLKSRGTHVPTVFYPYDVRVKYGQEEPFLLHKKGVKIPIKTIVCYSFYLIGTCGLLKKGSKFYRRSACVRTRAPLPIYTYYIYDMIIYILYRPHGQGRLSLYILMVKVVHLAYGSHMGNHVDSTVPPL